MELEHEAEVKGPEHNALCVAGDPVTGVMFSTQVCLCRKCHASGGHSADILGLMNHVRGHGVPAEHLRRLNFTFLRVTPDGLLTVAEYNAATVKRMIAEAARLAVDQMFREE